MFSVELVFKIAGREVALDKFAEALVGRSLEAVRKDIETLRTTRELSTPRFVEKRETQPRAVGIDRAAELLSISPHTVRKYVRERKLHAVHAGRRVLIPMETLENALQEGFPSSRR